MNEQFVPVTAGGLRFFINLENVKHIHVEVEETVILFLDDSTLIVAETPEVILAGGSPRANAEQRLAGSLADEPGEPLGDD